MRNAQLSGRRMTLGAELVEGLTYDRPGSSRHAGSSARVHRRAPRTWPASTRATPLATAEIGNDAGLEFAGR